MHSSNSVADVGVLLHFGSHLSFVEYYQLLSIYFLALKRSANFEGCGSSYDRDFISESEAQHLE